MRNALKKIFTCVCKAKFLQKMEGSSIFRMAERLYLWKFQFIPCVAENRFADFVSIALMLEGDLRYKSEFGNLIAFPYT